MNHRYHLRVGAETLEVFDTKHSFFNPSGHGRIEPVCVLIITCASRWIERNKQSLIEEYQIAPQNVKY